MPTRVLALILFGSAAVASAQTPIQSLSQCLGDNTSGRERKELARWIFLGISAHPENRQFASQAARDATDVTDKAVAATFTRLLTQSCVTQARAATKEGGAAAIQAGFETLGRLAMQELMSDKEVSSRMSAFEKHFDRKKLNSALGN